MTTEQQAEGRVAMAMTALDFPATPITESDIAAQYRAERRQNGCENCDSSGYIECPTCGGVGGFRVSRYIQVSWYIQQATATGYDDFEVCLDCDGGRQPCCECQEPTA